jgi:hypothetical protein
MIGLKKKGLKFVTRKNKKTKNPKVGSLVYDKDHKDWGIILEIERSGKILRYKIQFINDLGPTIMEDVHNSKYQECYE